MNLIKLAHCHLNATDLSSQCPPNFNIMSLNGTRFCFREQEDCVALPSDTFEITYSQVCGYVQGYSLRSRMYPNQSLSVNYVNGVSIREACSAFLCRDDQENKMAATYNVLAFKC